MPFNLSDLVPNEGSNKKRKRVGRGHGSGHGKTSGRGTKGQKSRSGPGVRLGFEGGQLPIQKRMPYKRGFTNIFKREWAEVNLATLERVFDAGSTVNPESLVEKKLVRKSHAESVVILGQGEIKKAINVKVHRLSAAAKQKIEAAGGTAEVI